MIISTQLIQNAIIGGALIGASAGTLYLFYGRIAGISGILVNAISLKSTLWRILFVLGLISAGILARFTHLADNVQLPDWKTQILAGFLVGLGTRLSNGCTSGHGICGLSRFSKRSFIAVITFMAFAFITVFITHHIIK